MKYIVRADYYSDGNIVPIGLTDGHGNSYVIENIETRLNMNTGEKEFQCLVNGKKMILVFSKMRWEIKHL